MEFLPYDQFSALRIEQFIDPADVVEDETGIEHSMLGFNQCRHLVFGLKSRLAFFYPASPPVVLAGLDFQLNEYFSVGKAQTVLSACAPPLRIGISVADVEAITGPPEYSTGREGYSFRRYCIGERWPYRVGCGFRTEHGLWSFWIARDDFYEPDDL